MSGSVSTRRLAARKSRLSIIVAVSVRWVTEEPARGRQGEPVCALKRVAAASRNCSRHSRRSMSGDALADQAFEFDRADFRAVLFVLAALLRLLVAVERRAGSGRGAMEAVDRRPEQRFEVGFETRVGQAFRSGRRRCRRRRRRRLRLRAGASGRARPGRGDSRGVGVRRGRDAVGDAVCDGSSGVFVVGRHGASCCRIDRAHRGLRGDERRRADRACTAERSESGRSRAEDGGGRLFCFAM